MVTTTTLKDRATTYNNKYFNGVLDLSTVSFKISKRMHCTRGKYHVKSDGSDQYITISDILLPHNKEWRTTLIHELIHCWQFQVLGVKALGHGDSFKTKSSVILKVSKGLFNITRLTSGNEEIQKVRKQRKGKKKVYAILDTKGTSYNFMRNLSPDNIDYLVGSGRKVYVYTGTLEITCNKNMDSLLYRSYNYQHSRVHPKIEMDLKEL